MTSISDWTGRVGHVWAKRAEALDALLGPVGDAGLEEARAEPGMRVLDIGCGAGASALALAATGADVTGIDVSMDLLDVARQRDPAETVTWLHGDAGALGHPHRYDVLHSRCGIMFFPSPAMALSHLRHQARKEARFVAVCWRDAEQNGWARVPLEAAAPVIGEAAASMPPAGGEGPFGWARPARFTGILGEAGWRGISHYPVDRRSVIGRGMSSADLPEGARVDGSPEGLEAAVAFCLTVGPLAARLRGTPPVLVAAVAEALRKTLAPRIGPDGCVRLGAAAWVVTAVA